jgi:hypothetical protein
MSRLPSAVLLPALLVLLLVTAGCITSGSSAPKNLPPDKLDQITGTLNQNGTAWIVIDPVGDHAIGDTFVVTATTDLPAGEMVLVRTWPVSFARSDKYVINNGTSQNVTVSEGSAGINTVSLTLSAADFREATYIIAMEKVTAKNAPVVASAARWYTVTPKT